MDVPENLLTTSGLSILLRGVILLLDATSYDKYKITSSDSIMNDEIENTRCVSFDIKFTRQRFENAC